MAGFLVFCESPVDFETIRILVERVLREHGSEWVRDLFEGSPEAARALWHWLPDGEGRNYFDLHRLSDYASRLQVRVPHGHFAGQPGAAGALMARTAFYVAREISRDQELDAVLLVWDMDDQGKDRRLGLKQAREEARSLVEFKLLLGCADPMREAWVLAGFEPETDAERARLSDLRQELGFHPCEEAHRLDAKQEQARRNPKRVLSALMVGNYERETRCWSEAPLVLLRARGGSSGLTAFLDEVAQSLVPLLG